MRAPRPTIFTIVFATAAQENILPPLTFFVVVPLTHHFLLSTSLSPFSCHAHLLDGSLCTRSSLSHSLSPRMNRLWWLVAGSDVSAARLSDIRGRPCFNRGTHVPASALTTSLPPLCLLLSVASIALLQHARWIFLHPRRSFIATLQPISRDDGCVQRDVFLSLSSSTPAPN